jgi:hypothetical protein
LNGNVDAVQPIASLFFIHQGKRKGIMKKFYILHQWLNDGAKAITVHQSFSTHDQARAHFEKWLYKVSIHEQITFPVEAETEEQAIEIATREDQWALP